MSPILPDQQELALTESRTMRDARISRTDVLDKVGALALLPGDTYATTDMVAAFYEVEVEAVKNLPKRFRDELDVDGFLVVQRRDFARFNLNPANPNTRSMALYPRQAILRAGMLLRDSEVAKQARTYLLGSESSLRATPSVPTSFADALELAARQAREIEAVQAENAELAATNAKLSPKARVADQYEANPGITPTVFHKMHFPEIGERQFFEHLYRKDYLIDQRNTRWDERKQEWKDGPEHSHPTAKGKRYFYLQSRLDRNRVRRQQTLVIPGDAEHDLVAALERDGLPSKNQPALPGSVVQMPSQRRIGGVR